MPIPGQQWPFLFAQTSLQVLEGVLMLEICGIQAHSLWYETAGLLSFPSLSNITSFTFTPFAVTSLLLMAQTCFLTFFLTKKNVHFYVPHNCASV